MLIEQPPLLYRLLFPEAIWRIKRHRRRVVYLTFDDGPIPEVTPWVLDLLDREDIKGTFFLVGDNVARNPEIFEEIKRRGHSWGNHTMNHIQGIKVSRQQYLDNVDRADELIGSVLFRPPHGTIRWSQGRSVKTRYNIIMQDVVSRDYSKKITPEQVFENVKRYTRNGSIIVFHDSLKAERNLRYALPRTIKWLKTQGYEILPIPM